MQKQNNHEMPLYVRILHMCVSCVQKTRSNSIELTEDVPPSMREAILRLSTNHDVEIAAERWSKNQNPNPQDAMNAVMFLKSHLPYDVMLLYSFVSWQIDEKLYHEPNLILRQAVQQGHDLIKEETRPNAVLALGAKARQKTTIADNAVEE